MEESRLVHGVNLVPKPANETQPHGGGGMQGETQLTKEVTTNNLTAWKKPEQTDYKK